MKRLELAPFLKFEVDRWAAKPYGRLQAELQKRSIYPSATGPIKYLTEVALAEEGFRWIQVSVAVCSEKVLWSAIYPLTSSFRVHADGRVEFF